SAIFVRSVGRFAVDTFDDAGPVFGSMRSGRGESAWIAAAGDGSADWRIPSGYGTIVTLQCGPSSRAAAIAFDDRSCRRRCQSLVYSRRGTRTVRWVSSSGRMPVATTHTA